MKYKMQQTSLNGSKGPLGLVGYWVYRHVHCHVFV